MNDIKKCLDISLEIKFDKYTSTFLGEIENEDVLNFDFKAKNKEYALQKISSLVDEFYKLNNIDDSRTYSRGVKKPEPSSNEWEEKGL